MWDDRVFPQILMNQKLCIVSLMALMSFVCQQSVSMNLKLGVSKVPQNNMPKKKTS